MAIFLRAGPFNAENYDKIGQIRKRGHTSRCNRSLSRMHWSTILGGGGMIGVYFRIENLGEGGIIMGQNYVINVILGIDH